MGSLEVESESSKYIFVDLDGTLLKSDLFFEGLIVIAKQSPLVFLQIIFILLLRGKAQAKALLAEKVSPDLQLTPLTVHFFDYLLNEKKSGRKVILATASNQLWAEQVVKHFTVFEDYIASTANFNNIGKNKLAKIKEYTGGQPYEYCGNDSRDLPIWAEAQEIVVVNASPAIIKKACALKKPKYLFNEQYRPVGKSLIKLLRPHQWAKNLLIFLPIGLAHHIFDFANLCAALLAFIVFSLTASAVYVLNDLADLEADRLHQTKNKRPLASADFPIKYVFLLIPVLIIAALGITATLPINFAYSLLVYFLVTTAYSIHLKQVVVLDIIILSLLYTIRILAGGFATQVEVSFWLMAFSLFFFFSLATLKRYVELVKSANLSSTVARRGYSALDLNIVAIVGVAGGLVSVLVMALYIHNSGLKILYRDIEFLWMLCPVLLYWITRIWILANRGQVNEDPVLFALKDRASYFVGLITIVILCLAK